MTKLIVTADAGGTVNLRQLPSKTASIISPIKVKTEVELIEKTNDEWYKIQVGNKQGYMMAKYLKEPGTSTISKEDIRKIYNSLKETLTLIEKILK